MNRAGKALMLALLCVVSCKSPEKIADTEDPALPGEPFYRVSDSLAVDPGLEQWLEPYRSIYKREMDRPVAVSEGAFTFGRPESSMGNLVADMIRYRAAQEMQAFVHLALILPEGLLAEFEKGTITLGDVHELMPYDHTLVVLELAGRHVSELAGEIAARGGVPLSGMRMSIQNGQANGVLVNSGSIDPDATYYLATSSHIADGGGDLNALEHASGRHDHSLLIRDLFIDHLRSRRVFVPAEDQRIRIRR